MSISFDDIVKHINAEQDVIDAIDRHYQQYNALLDACDLVQRAWVGDGVDMATAVDACLLAVALANPS